VSECNIKTPPTHHNATLLPDPLLHGSTSKKLLFFKLFQNELRKSGKTFKNVFSKTKSHISLLLKKESTPSSSKQSRLYKVQKNFLHWHFVTCNRRIGRENIKFFKSVIVFSGDKNSIEMVLLLLQKTVGNFSERTSTGSQILEDFEGSTIRFFQQPGCGSIGYFRD
jgi:hypothetical protein